MVADVGRPFPICVGTSHPGTAAVVALSRRAQQLGAQAVMVTPNKEAVPSSDDTLLELYQRVADGCPDLPIVLQDHPASTQVHMTPALVAHSVLVAISVTMLLQVSLASPSAQMLR